MITAKVICCDFDCGKNEGTSCAPRSESNPHTTVIVEKKKKKRLINNLICRNLINAKSNRQVFKVVL